MIEHDKSGRMKYNPELHDRQGLAWREDEVEYLIRWYYIIGPEEMSLALGRTEGTVASKVCGLQKQGKMKKTDFKRCSVRILKAEVNGKAILNY